MDNNNCFKLQCSKKKMKKKIIHILELKYMTKYLNNEQTR